MNSFIEGFVITVGLGMFSLAIPGFIWVAGLLWLFYVLHTLLGLISALGEVIDRLP